MNLNSILAARGEEPVKNGDIYWVMTTQGPMPWLNYEGKLGDYTPIGTGGAMGSQDAMGGPSTDADDPSIPEDDNENNDNTGNVNDGSEGADNATSTEGKQPDNKKWNPTLRGGFR